MAKEISHYLLTMYVAGVDVHVHGYLMCDDKRHVEAAADQMIEAAEGMGLRMLPMVLATTLSTGVEIVREILGKISEEAKHNIESATDRHFSAWMMGAENPDDARLMELH
jgi:N-acetylglucosamine-6-phosphate deacetylase